MLRLSDKAIRTIKWYLMLDKVSGDHSKGKRTATRANDRITDIGSLRKALAGKIAGSAELEDEEDYYSSDEFNDAISSLKYEILDHLDYQEVTRIETMMLIGREMWKEEHENEPSMIEEMSNIPFDDLDTWRGLFNISASEEMGGDKKIAIMGIINRDATFLREYLDNVNILHFNN